MMAGSTNALQSEAGYIDARPQIRQIDENLLRRAAGPYIWVNRVILDARRNLLVNPGNRTFAALLATSESCHKTAISQFYSMTSSARSRIAGGIVRPSSLAALRLITRSNFADWCTGNSAGFLPLRMRPV